MAQRRLVLVRKDRLGQRLEQRHEPLQAVGQRPRRDRQPLGGHPRGNAVHGAEAGTVLEQEACPEAGPVERPGEQPRHRGRRHFHGRRRALAGPAPARTADHALVGLDLDLDEGGFLGAVRRIELPAPAADARIRRRVVLRCAHRARAAGCGRGRARRVLAALVFRARLVRCSLLRRRAPSTAPPHRTKPLKPGASGSATSSRGAGGRSPDSARSLYWRRDLACSGVADGQHDVVAGLAHLFVDSLTSDAAICTFAHSIVSRPPPGMAG